MKHLLHTFALVLLMASTALGQVSIGALGSPGYTQDFNSLLTTGTGNTFSISGWSLATVDGATDGSGTATSRTVYNAGTGSSNTGAFYSFGVAGVNAVGDRALGAVASNGFTGASGNSTNLIGVQFTNNTGSTIRHLVVMYDYEQWRKENNASTQPLFFDYTADGSVTTVNGAVGSSGWTNVASMGTVTPIAAATASTALDGNAGANRVANLKVIITGLSIADGATFWIRWRDLNDAGVEHGHGIDNVQVIAYETATWYATDLAGADNLNTLTNWSLDTDGTSEATDAEPSLPSLTTDYFAFQVNRQTGGDGSFTLGTSVALATNSSLTVGNGTLAATLSVPDPAELTGTVNVSNNATLQLGRLSGVAGSFPTFNTLATGSTVAYNGAGAQGILGITYSNLVISGSGTKTPIAAATVNRMLQLEAGTLDLVGFGVSVGATGFVRRSGGTVISAVPTYLGAISIQYGPGFNDTPALEWPTASGARIDSLHVFGTSTVTALAYASQIVSVRARIDGSSTLALGGVTRVLTLTSADSSFSGVGTLDLSGAAHTVNIADATPSLPTTFTPGTSSTVVLNRNGNQTIPAATYANLSLTTGGIKTLAGNTSSIGTLTISRPLDAAGFRFTLGQSGSGASNSGTLAGGFFVYNGYLRRFVNNNTSPLDFPVSADGLQSRNANIQFASANAIGSTLEVWNRDFQAQSGLPNVEPADFPIVITDPGDPLVGSDINSVYNVLNVKWDINASSITENYNLILTAEGMVNFTGLTGSTLRLFKTTASGTPKFEVVNGFDVPGTSRVGNTAIVRHNGVTLGFSQFFIGTTDDAFVLPVTWLAVAAERVSAGAEVSWSTASELNNERFEVQRSTTEDFSRFVTVGQVAGRGTSQTASSYRLIDTDLSNAELMQGPVYYRIRQVDFDGRSSLSRVVRLDAAAEWAVYPNPVTGPLQLVGVGLSRTDAPVQVQLMGADGRLLVDLTAAPATVAARVDAAMNQAGAGLYVLRVGGKTIRLVKP